MRWIPLYVAAITVVVLLTAGVQQLKEKPTAEQSNTWSTSMSKQEQNKIVSMLQKLDPRLLVLVDKKHALSADTIPPDLVSLDNYKDTLLLNRANMQVSMLMIDDLLDMVTAASIEKIEILISSAYRSYKYQDNLFKRAVTIYGREQAERETAIPGHSQHQLGLALDFGSITPAFANTAASKWLVANASKFGFSLSYPENAEEVTGYVHEIWHYRYIGKIATSIEKTYFSESQQRMLEFWNDYQQRS